MRKSCVYIGYKLLDACGRIVGFKHRQKLEASGLGIKQLFVHNLYPVKQRLIPALFYTNLPLLNDRLYTLYTGPIVTTTN